MVVVPRSADCSNYKDLAKQKKKISKKTYQKLETQTRLEPQPSSYTAMVMEMVVVVVEVVEVIVEAKIKN